MSIYMDSGTTDSKWLEVEAPAWMRAALELNPPYNGWAPGDDYMRGFARQGDRRAGWDTAVCLDDVAALQGWGLDDLNICADFYFGIVENPDGPILRLTVWLLHPRKGASRGAVVARIEEGELASVCEWLAEAHRQNSDRFAAVVARAEGRTDAHG